jgi:hypothetical protein
MKMLIFSLLTAAAALPFFARQPAAMACTTPNC